MTVKNNCKCYCNLNLHDPDPEDQCQYKMNPDICKSLVIFFFSEN